MGMANWEVRAYEQMYSNQVKPNFIKLKARLVNSHLGSINSSSCLAQIRVDPWFNLFETHLRLKPHIGYSKDLLL